MKKINSMFFTALVIGVLCAGNCFGAAVAERRQRLGHLWRQLRRQQSLPSGCLCIFPMETGSPFCSSHPIPGATVLK